MDDEGYQASRPTSARPPDDPEQRHRLDQMQDHARWLLDHPDVQADGNTHALLTRIYQLLHSLPRNTYAPVGLLAQAAPGALPVRTNNPPRGLTAEQIAHLPNGDPNTDPKQAYETLAKQPAKRSA